MRPADFARCNGKIYVYGENVECPQKENCERCTPSPPKITPYFVSVMGEDQVGKCSLFVPKDPNP